MKRKSIAVIGLGNILFQDEGAGIAASNMLKQKYPDLEVDIISAGTPGFHLLHQCQERKKIIFIDAGFCEAKPGEFRRFHHQEVLSIKKKTGYSAHEFDLIEFLQIAEQMGFLKDVDVSIYCIHVSQTELKSELSKEVFKGLPRLVSSVYDEIKDYLNVNDKITTG